MYENKVTFHSAASATATGTVMTTTGVSLVAVQITGTFVATVTFQGSIDGTNYVSLEAINSATGAKATTATAAGIYFVPVSGIRKFRCNLAWTSGTSITATGIGVENGNTMLADIDLGDTIIGNVAIDQTTDGTTNAVHLVAGTAIAGKVGIDQTTDGTTNKVSTSEKARTILSGELQGSATELQLPTISCTYVRFKACVSNAGNVYIGVDNVTKPDGTTDVTTGLELTPGDDTGWIPVANLNVFWRICDNAGDDLTYLALV